MQPLAFTHLRLRTPDKVLENATVVVEDGVFTSVAAWGEVPKGAREVDASGMSAVPGMVNAHDHLLGAWAPRFGRGPYTSVYGWIEDYHPSDVRAERDKVPHGVVVALGAYRNLLSGATFVAEHFLRGFEEHYRDLPVGFFEDYGREWVVRSLSDPDNWPAWGTGVKEELAFAEKTGTPFIIHVAEGIDAEARRELSVLDEAGGLGAATAIVHGLGLTDADRDRVAESGASVIWCPSSNHFLYNATADPRSLRERGIVVGLGTDSPISGGAHMLAELRSARTAWRLQYGEDPDPGMLLQFATTGSAAALRLEGKRGAVVPGAVADLCLFPSRSLDPATDLLGLEPWEFSLILAEGRPTAGDQSHQALFEADGRAFSVVRHADRTQCVVGDPLALLTQVNEALGYEKDLPFLLLSAP
jgi:cytosine/adenosine deaminase-related metal-dependent hydrolase